MKKIAALLLIGFLIAGCSKDDWMAKYYLFQAENAFSKAYSLRTKPGAEADRARHYQMAHDYFLKAYSIGPKFFTLTKIEQAYDTCLRLEDQTNAELFRQFGDEYAAAHPKEVEYGDVTGMVGLE